MEFAALGAVNIYALISGYVGYGRAWKPGNLIRLWLQAVFYCLVINLLFMFFYGTDVISAKELLASFFPLTGQTWWYLTSYAAVFLLMPVLNMCIEKLSREMAAKAIIGAAVLSWWDLISKKNIFKLEGGYSAIWLVFLYFVGAFIKKYYSDTRYKAVFLKYCGWIYLLTTCTAFVTVILLQKITLHIFGSVKGDRFFYGYTTPTVMLAALALFLYFSAVKIKRTKVITFLAPAAFGRYTDRSFPVTILVFLAGSILIFTFAALIDKLRGLLFTKLGIDALCCKCGDFFVGCLKKAGNRIAAFIARFY